MTDEKRELVKGIIIVIACAGLVVCSYLLGAYVGVDRSEYDRLVAERDGIIAEQRDAIGRLEGLLGEAQGRAEGLIGGLGDAIALAGQSSDRSKRIAILIDAIDDAIGNLETLIDGLGNEAQGSGSGASSASTGP